MSIKLHVPRTTYRVVQKVARIRGAKRAEAAAFLLYKARQRPAAEREPSRTLLTESGPWCELALPDDFDSESTDSELLAWMLMGEAERVPGKFRRSDAPVTRPYEFDIGDGLASISSGTRTFVDHAAPTVRDVKALEYVGDLQPPYYTPQHQYLHQRYQQRYQKYLDDPEGFYIPTGGAVAVDAGAYVGYKAIALHDAMPRAEIVIAIELMLENYFLLEKNVRTNRLGHKIATHPYALAEERGTGMQASLEEGSYTNTLADLDMFEGRERRAVPTFSLADVLSLTEPDQVDYLNVQVNGAELSVLKGLGSWFNKVKRFYIACPYAGKGTASQEQLRKFLTEGGASMVHEKPGLIVADGPSSGG